LRSGCGGRITSARRATQFSSEFQGDRRAGRGRILAGRRRVRRHRARSRADAGLTHLTGLRRRKSHDAATVAPAQVPAGTTASRRRKASGSARARCSLSTAVDNYFLVAFSCKGRDLCPSCAIRRMVDVSAHMVDQVLPRVQHRQWVLSMPKRIRWHLRHKPDVINGLLTIFLRAVETTIRQSSPGAPAGARFGAVAFVHRFGSYLNSHVHFHVLVTDGVFSAGDDGEAVFHPAVDLEREDIAEVQKKMRQRGLRWLHRHGHIDDDALHVLDSLDHAGGWSVDASVTIPHWDRHGLEHLVRYCARPPLSQERLGRLNEQTLVYSLRRPTVDGRTELQLTPIELLDLLSQLVTPPRLHKHRYCGVLAPNAALRAAVTASAEPAGATLQLLEQARASMGLPSASPAEPNPSSPLAHHRLRAGRADDRADPRSPRRADAGAGGDAGTLATAARVRVRPDDRHCGMAGDGPDGGAEGERLGVIALTGDRARGPWHRQGGGWGRVSATG